MLARANDALAFNGKPWPIRMRVERPPISSFTNGNTLKQASKQTLTTTIAFRSVMKTVVTTLVAACLWSVSNALDIEIESYACSGAYPVKADVYLEGADGSSRGTFGEKIRIYGECKYGNIT